MFISKNGPNTMDMETMKHYARIASEAFMDDPVYAYATKDEKKRKDFLYHFNLARLYVTYNRGFNIYINEEKSGICVYRDSRSSYTAKDFLTVPNFLSLVKHLSSTIKVVNFNDKLNPEYFPEDTYIVSPTYVDKNHWGKGIAKQLMREGTEELKAQGYNVGLETQNPENVTIYEKIGFKTIKYEYFPEEDIHSYWMLYQG